ncbi:hypothetical protein D3C72_86880 [compost metagenome]
MKRRHINPHSGSRAADLWRRWGGYAIGGFIVLVLVAVVWYLVSGTASTKREVAATPMLMLPPPPPPPPEPEKLPEPEPEKVQQEAPPEPTTNPQEAPADAATPSPDAGDPTTINDSAQAGTDNFGVMAGRGGGMTGGGGGLGSYSGYVANALQQAFARDPRTRTLAFQEIRINLWLDADGKATRVELLQGTGNTQTDEAVLAMARDFRSDVRPPATQRFPARLTIKGRRP